LGTAIGGTGYQDYSIFKCFSLERWSFEQSKLGYSIFD
jgi:hypothetical protein